MARVKLTEYKAKTLLQESYSGIAIHKETIDDDVAKLGDGAYIIKVDQGIKKRGKQGLIVLNATKESAHEAVNNLADKGNFTRFIAETMLPHEDSEERYLSIERIRGGFQILYSEHGGVEVEEHPEDIQKYSSIDDVPLPLEFLKHLTGVMNREHLSFVEINPLIVRDGECILLDAAVLADSAGIWQASWTEADIVDARTKTEAEIAIEELNNGSPASFSLRILNQDGAIWLLLSGGGASITIADEAANRNKADLIGNYGEYSGGPTREETQVYTEAVIKQMLGSNAHKKALIIAGGVANFTDVRKTFSGIIDALANYLDAIKEAGVKVYVRRGGPNEEEGLKVMSEFLTAHDILGSMHGSETVLTDVVDEALEYIDA